MKAPVHLDFSTLLGQFATGLALAFRVVGGRVVGGRVLGYSIPSRDAITRW